MHILVKGTTLSSEAFAEITSLERSQLIAGDPVTCARFYKRKIEFFQEKILTALTVLGDVTDFAGTDEFQSRGAPHTHMMLWNRDAPFYGQSSREEVIAFYEWYITTYSGAVPSNLAELQKYGLSNRCGGKKGKSSFGLTKPPMATTDILHHLSETEVDEDVYRGAKNNYKLTFIAMRTHNERVGSYPYDAGVQAAMPSFEDFLKHLKMDVETYMLAICTSIARTTFMFQCKPLDIMINAFNEPILRMWQANMDVQLITDPYQTARYVAYYIMKTQKGMSHLLCRVRNEQFENTGLLIRKLGKTCINAAETCAQEAVYTILALKLKRSSRQVQFIPTCRPDARHWMESPGRHLRL